MSCVASQKHWRDVHLRGAVRPYLLGGPSDHRPTARLAAGAGSAGAGNVRLYCSGTLLCFVSFSSRCVYVPAQPVGHGFRPSGLAVVTVVCPSGPPVIFSFQFCCSSSTHQVLLTEYNTVKMRRGQARSSMPFLYLYAKKSPRCGVRTGFHYFVLCAHLSGCPSVHLVDFLSVCRRLHH